MQLNYLPMTATAFFPAPHGILVRASSGDVEISWRRGKAVSDAFQGPRPHWLSSGPVPSGVTQSQPHQWIPGWKNPMPPFPRGSRQTAGLRERQVYNMAPERQLTRLYFFPKAHGHPRHVGGSSWWSERASIVSEKEPAGKPCCLG